MKRFKVFCIAGAALFLFVIGIVGITQSKEIYTAAENARVDYGSCQEHTFPDEYIVVKEATCQSTGTKYRVCTVCGAKDIVEIPVDSDNHLYVSSKWTTYPVPTCISGGEKYKICTSCNKKVEVTELPPDPEAHQADGDHIVLTDSTCQEPGEKAYRCKLCGEYFGNTPVDINPDNHVTSENSKWEVTVLPTCGDEGEMVCYCDKCGAVALAKPVAPTGEHILSDEWIIDKEPTCTEPGIKSRYCTVCGQAVETEEIPVNGENHSFGSDFITDKAPTCVEAGEKSRHCIYCGERTEITEIPVDENAHQYGEEWIVSKEPSCSEAGLKHKVCALCGEESVPVEIEKTEHNYGKYEVIKESADGMSAQVKYTCIDCGYEYITVITYGENDGTGDIGNESGENGKYILVANADTVIKIDNSSMLVYNVARNMEPEKFLSNFKNSSSFVLYSKDGNIVQDSSYVGTGCYLNYQDINGIVTNYKISVTGDLDSDGKVTASDARQILRAAAGLNEVKNEYKTAADVNSDGKVTASDARTTLRVAANLEYFKDTYKN